MSYRKEFGRELPTRDVIDARTASAPAPKKGASVGVKLVGLAIEIPPAAYVAVTGTVPGWARVWLATWLILWGVIIVVQAVSAQAAEGTR